jgi:hypothetical protein
LWRHVLLDGGHRHRAGRLDDAARVDEHVLDGGADRVGVDGDEVVDQLAADAEGFLAHQLDGGAVGEQAHVAQRHALFRATDCIIASESFICTPMTLISGRTALM